MAIELDGVTYTMDVAIDPQQVQIAGDGVRQWVRDLNQERNPLVNMIIRAAPAIATIGVNRLTASWELADRAALASEYPDPIDRLVAAILWKVADHQEHTTIRIISEATDDERTRTIRHYEVETAADPI